MTIIDSHVYLDRGIHLSLHDDTLQTLMDKAVIFLAVVQPMDHMLEDDVEFDVPAYAHTGTAGIAEPFHVMEPARRYLSLAFIMGHAGSSDYGEDAVRPLGFQKNVWLETSRNGLANYNFWCVRNRPKRIMFGSSASEYIPTIEIETLCDIVTGAEDREAVFFLAMRKRYSELINHRQTRLNFF